jgi:2-dehydro-3-deoxyphosphogluconate aldolase/(4S)-4-hydroxy-2-oxoglutarate aldolase
MNQADANARLGALKIVPVVKIEREEWAQPLANALKAANLPVAEVTLRSHCSLDAIKQMSTIDDLLLGAGTVLNVEQAKSSVAAGAKFIVSPGLDEDMVAYCLENSIPVFPGVSTASEVQRAHNMGLNVVKLFPAEAVGGVKTLKALSGPFPAMKFMPTGGVNLSNLNDYLEIESVLAVGGSWMVKPNLYADDNFDQVTSLAVDAVEKADSH